LFPIGYDEIIFLNFRTPRLVRDVAAYFKVL